MKRLASRLTWWQTLPHKSTPRSTPQKGEASHGPYWHRRAQAGQPDLHPRRGRRGDRAAHPDRAGALRRRARDPAPRPDCDRGLDRQRMGGPLPGGPRPRGHRRGPELRAHVCDAVAQGEDRPARCARPRGGVPARRLPPRPSALRSPAPRAGPLGGPRRPRPDAHARHLASSGPCSASTATASPPAVRRTLSPACRAFPCRAACARSSRRCSPSCAPSTGSSRTPTPRSNTSPSRIRACRACAPSPASAPSPPPPSSPPSTMPSASATRISSRPTSASCPASTARARHSAAAPITKAGHSRTRWLLIQAAVSILRRRPPQADELRTWALRIAARRGKQVAVVALARRLAGILYALLRDGSVFEPQHVRHPRPTAAALVNV